MTPLEVAAAAADVTVKVGTGALAFTVLVVVLLVLARPARDAFLYIAPDAARGMAAVAGAARERHEAGLARLAALDEAEAAATVRHAQHEDAVQLLRGAS